MLDDPYEGFAERYDRMKPKDPLRERFFHDLFAKHRVSAVLDCACGTGLDLILFDSFGCKVHGSDRSEAMLAQARKNIAEAKKNIPLSKVDYRELDKRFEAEFDAVVCMSNSINECFEDAEVLRALRSIKSVLRTGGILVFDQGQSDAGMKKPPRFDPAVNDRDFSRLLVMDYSQNVMEVEVFDFIHTQDVFDFKHSSFRIRIRLKDDWDRILAGAGFSKVDYAGDWEGSPYDKASSKRLIAVARE
ncbi:MAG: class I SAM-dependent methyltransferase [Bacillota bacterium]